VATSASSSRPRRAPAGPAGAHRWSSAVTRNSNALDLEAGVFTLAPRKMARSLKRSAERSQRRKSSPYRSAMSMLTFYENRAGRRLPADKRRALRRAKDELRALFGRPRKDFSKEVQR
jgi:uncharacterized protein DUF3175